MQDHALERHLVHKSSAVRQVRDLVKRGNFDVFINLCDGAWDEDRAGIEVVQTRERLGAAFTGANSAFFEPTREAMKLVCHQFGIATPNFMFAPNLATAALAGDALRFPMIVKHGLGGGGYGRCDIRMDAGFAASTSSPATRSPGAPPAALRRRPLRRTRLGLHPPQTRARRVMTDASYPRAIWRDDRP